MAKDKFKKDRVDNVVCEECGKKIPKARLKVVPDARFCVACMTVYEIDYPVDDSIYLPEPDANELNDIISSDD